MAETLGRDGSLSFNSGVMAQVTSFKMNISQGSYDANYLGAGGWDNSVGGRKSWEVEVEGNYDADVSSHGGLAVGDEAVGIFYTEGDTTGNEKQTGTCRITDIGTTNNEDGFVEFSIKLKGVGELVKSTVA